MKRFTRRTRLAEIIRRKHRDLRNASAKERSLLRNRQGAVRSSIARVAQRIATLAIPETFSFLKNPNDVLAVIETGRRAAWNPKIDRIVADFTECRWVSLGASAVLQRTLYSIAREREFRKLPPLEIFAQPSSDVIVNEIVNVPFISKEQFKTIVRSPMITGKPDRMSFSKERDRAGTEIVEYIDKCLNAQSMSLTPEGRKYIGNLITEALGNAEEHGGPWTAYGFFLQRDNADPGECHMLLYNVGTTIYESLTSPKASPEIKADANALASRHLSRGFLGLIRRKWNRECLFTLYSLQEGVSSKLHRDSSRGNGTVEVIRAFSKLSASDRKMCILSGRAYILFDGEYHLSDITAQGSERRKVIAFNDSNDLEEPPDEDCVYALERTFAGTIVDLKFKLDTAKCHIIAKEHHAETNPAR